MTGLRTYLLSLVAVSLLVSLVMALLPNGTGKRMLSLTGALLIMLVVVGPLVKVGSKDMAAVLSRHRMRTEEIRTGIAVQNRELLSELIKEKTEAYILDKAAQMNLKLDVSVKLQEQSSYPYPIHVVLSGAIPPDKKEKLSCLIEENLGIPPEEQEWKQKE